MEERKERNRKEIKRYMNQLESESQGLSFEIRPKEDLREDFKKSLERIIKKLIKIVEELEVGKGTSQILIDKEEIIKIIEDLRNEIEETPTLQNNYDWSYYYSAGMNKAFDKVVDEINKKYLSDDNLILKWLDNALDMYLRNFEVEIDCNDKDLEELQDLINRIERKED